MDADGDGTLDWEEILDQVGWLSQVGQESQGHGTKMFSSGNERRLFFLLVLSNDYVSHSCNYI